MYTNWYFRLGSLCERNSMRIRPLDSREASVLEIGSGRFANRIRAHVTRPQSGPIESAVAQPSPRTRVVLS